MGAVMPPPLLRCYAMMIIEGAKSWFSSPLNGKGSAVDYFLFVGLILVAVYFWSRVIVRIG